MRLSYKQFLKLNFLCAFVKNLFRLDSYKYVYPNDEALAAHPMAKFGIGFYGLFEVINSPWITELCVANRTHSRHTEGLFENYRHFIARFKDVTLDIISTSMIEIQITKEQLIKIINDEIKSLENDN